MSSAAFKMCFSSPERQTRTSHRTEYVRIWCAQCSVHPTCHKTYWNGPRCSVSLIKGHLTRTSHFDPQICLVVPLSLSCSWNNGDGALQTAVSNQRTVWGVVYLLLGPDHTIEQSHACTHGIHAPPGPGRTIEDPTGRIPTETQRGANRTLLQGRVGNHLR